MHHISEEDFRSINWLPTSKRVNQCMNIITSKFGNNTCPYYLKKKKNLLHIVEQIQEINLQNLKSPFARQKNMGQKAISFIDPSLCNSLPELIKKTDFTDKFLLDQLGYFRLTFCENFEIQDLSASSRKRN